MSDSDKDIQIVRLTKGPDGEPAVSVIGGPCSPPAHRAPFVAHVSTEHGVMAVLVENGRYTPVDAKKLEEQNEPA